MSLEMKERYTVIDRRGEAREPEPLPAPVRAPTAPPGDGAVRFHCGHCRSEVSENCMVAQIVLPAPAPDGNIAFVPQTIYLIPLVCPACGASNVNQKPVSPLVVPRPV